mgnify:CR=1 FL=1
MMISLRVNGHPYQADIDDPNLTLLTYLREYLGLTGAKSGCAEGHCGTCTVIVDGRAQRACLLRMGRMAGRSVQTVEGLCTSEAVHPLQFAFVQQGAVQCGFCTPGMIMAAKALLDANPDPTEDDIRRALAGNLCRCTGYVKVIMAVQEAARMLREGITAVPRDRLTPEGSRLVGARVPRIDGLAKATGELRFADDLSVEGMLVARVLRSEWPHARILGIDVSEARSLPGVVAVLTADDVPGEKAVGLIQRDWPVLAVDRVRYIGEAVAVVYAESAAQAEAALGRIRVRYEPLPVISTPEEALAPGATQIHPGGNILAHYEVRKGDVAAGFAQAAVVVEGDYSTPAIEHAFLEPQACLAIPGPAGGVTVHVGSQGPVDDRRQIAAALGLPLDWVRVVHLPMGGGFGGKEDITVQVLAALGAVRLGRPVKMTMSRYETMIASTKRHAMRMHYRTGATREGKVVAVEATIHGDTGAYASVGGSVVLRAASFCCGPYAIPNVRVNSYAVYTNNVPAGAMRGFGNPQATFAAEVQMDRLAEALSMDPIELRRRNMLDVGDSTITGHRLTESVGARPTLEAVAAALKSRPLPVPRHGWKIGVGVASSYKNVGLGTGIHDGAGAALELTEDGCLVLHVGCTEMGQGATTAMAQLAAQATGWPLGRICVLAGDTQRDPAGGMTTASRQTFITGNAVVRAGEKLRRALWGCVAREFGVPEEDLRLEGETFYDRRSGAAIVTLRELAGRLRGRGERLRVEDYYVAPETHLALDVPPEGHPPGEDCLHFAYCFGTQAVVIEANEATGQVNVLRVIAAHDVGRAVNPLNIEGQIEGGVVMGIGYGLSEEFVMRDGRVVTDTLRKLCLPRIEQTPEIETIIIEDPHPEGPFGAKGMGELPASIAAPAIVNAIHDALGVWVTSLPARPERVLAALRAQ